MHKDQLCDPAVTGSPARRLRSAEVTGCGISPGTLKISWTYQAVTDRTPLVASWTSELTVRPVLPGERTRYQELLAGLHWLGPRLFGSVIRHVAVLDGGWVALLGYGSAVLRCTARDQVIGWPDGDRVDRLPMLAGNQRFCVLPDTRGARIWPRRCWPARWPGCPPITCDFTTRSCSRSRRSPIRPATPAPATPRPGSPAPGQPAAMPGGPGDRGMPSTGG